MNIAILPPSPQPILIPIQAPFLSQTSSWVLSGISEKAGHFTVYLSIVLNLYVVYVFSKVSKTFERF